MGSTRRGPTTPVPRPRPAKCCGDEMQRIRSEGALMDVCVWCSHTENYPPPLAPFAHTPAPPRPTPGAGAGTAAPTRKTRQLPDYDGIHIIKG